MLLHPKISYIIFWIFTIMFHIYTFDPLENDFMYNMKYEVKVLLKNLYGYSTDPTPFTRKIILSSLHCNDEFGDFKHRFSLGFLCYVLFVCLFPHQYQSILVNFIRRLYIWEYKYSHFVLILPKLFKNQYISFHHSFHWIVCTLIISYWVYKVNILQFWVFQSMNMI